MELTANQAAQSLSNHSPRVRGLGQASSKQVDIVDVSVDALQGSDSGAIHYIV